MTRVDVTSAWIRAWEQLSIVAQTGDATGLEVYFANSALEAMLASREDTAGNPVHQLGHTLRVDFYSQDGQVIGLAADEVKLVRSAEVDGVLGWSQTTESYDAVLLLRGRELAHPALGETYRRASLVDRSRPGGGGLAPPGPGRR